MGESGNPLAIDPTILFLQIVAFAILYWVLSRYLFRPLLGVMAQREEQIAADLEAGEQARRELAGIAEERAKVVAEAREQGREVVRQSVREAEEARERILAEAREEAQELRQRARESIELEREAAALGIRHEVVDLALLAAGKAVLGRLDPETHRQAVDDFISELEQAS